MIKTRTTWMIKMSCFSINNRLVNSKCSKCKIKMVSRKTMMTMMELMTKLITRSCNNTGKTRSLKLKLKMKESTKAKTI